MTMLRFARAFALFIAVALAQPSTAQTDVVARAMAAQAKAAAMNGAALGQVATRSAIPMNVMPSATATWAMGRTMHWSRDDIVDPTILVPNFWVNGTYAETVVGVGTVKAAIEYPAGVFTPANEGTAALVSGFTRLTFKVAIPRGRQFWVRQLYQSSSGIPFVSFNNLNAYDPSEGLEFGTGTPSDKVTTGTVSKSYQGRSALATAAILAMTKRRSVAILGTSRAWGIADLASDAGADLGNVARLIGPAVGYTNLAVSGSKGLDYVTAPRTYIDQLIGYTTDVVNELGVNDNIGTAGIAPTIAATRASIAALYPTKRVIGTTLTPNPTFATTSVNITSLTRSGGTATATVASTASLTTGQTVVIAGVTGAGNTSFLGAKVITVVNGTSFTFAVPNDSTLATTVPGTISYSDAFSTLAGQTLGVNGQNVVAFNALARAGIPGEAAILDLSDFVDPYRTGKWPVARDPGASVGTAGFGSRDGLHETMTLLEIMRDASAGAVARLLN